MQVHGLGIHIAVTSCVAVGVVAMQRSAAAGRGLAGFRVVRMVIVCMHVVIVVMPMPMAVAVAMPMVAMVQVMKRRDANQVDAKPNHGNYKQRARQHGLWRIQAL